jgi:hypothetical protein
MSKQTSTQWLFEKLWDEPKDKLTWYAILQQAKEMHKQEIENAFVECWKANMPDGYECKLSAEQYYNETFNK